jgi:SAM-dependent methyltransferase
MALFQGSVGLQTYSVSFRGETAEFYASCRRGFDSEGLAFIVSELRVRPESLVVDVGCGGGQLTIPLSGYARHVAGIDPEPQMLAHARDAAAAASATTITSWLLGSASDLPALVDLLGGPRADAVTISNAVHFIDTRRLAQDLRSLLAAGGRVGVIANGVPIWSQDSPWSQALREFVMKRYETDLSSSRYTDEATLERCQTDLAEAGFRTRREKLAGTTAVSADWLLGNLFSAMSNDWIPAPADRAQYAAEFTAALREAQPSGDFVENTTISMLVAE